MRILRNSAEFAVFWQCWRRALRRSNSGVPYDPGIPLLALRVDDASIPEVTLWDWTRMGLRRVGDLLEGGGSWSFAALFEEFELHAGFFFVCRALRLSQDVKGSGTG